jgi:hypothetical protein
MSFVIGLFCASLGSGFFNSRFAAVIAAVPAEATPGFFALQLARPILFDGIPIISLAASVIIGIGFIGTRFQKESALGQRYRARTEGAAGKRKTTMIVALARKLLIALWRMVTTGEIPAGVALRTAAA